MSKSNKERPEKPTGVEISSGNVFLEDGEYCCLSTFSFMPFPVPMNGIVGGIYWSVVT